jgi:thymidylate synthase
MLMVVHQPMLEPRLHLLLPAAGWSTLEEYRLEVVEGLHPRDEEVGQSYTYHQRLFSYPGIKGPFDQIEFIVTKLAEATYSRRAQAITWDPDRDTKTPYPPCLQRVWCRAPRDEEGKLWLHLETTWRSRDAWAAAFPNMWALTDLQRLIAQRLSEKLDEEVSVGTYVDFSSSYHIYGKTIKRTGGSFTGFLEQVKLRPPEKRFLNSDDPTVQEIFEETRAKFTR